MTRAATLANVAQRLADRTRGWRTVEPSLGAILDASELCDEAMRRLAYLAAGEPPGEPTATAANLAGEASHAARAAYSLASCWPRVLPDREAVGDAQRLATSLLRTLARLASLTTKDAPHDQ